MELGAEGLLILFDNDVVDFVAVGVLELEGRGTLLEEPKQLLVVLAEPVYLVAKQAALVVELV